MSVSTQQIPEQLETPSKHRQNNQERRLESSRQSIPARTESPKSRASASQTLLDRRIAAAEMCLEKASRSVPKREEIRVEAPVRRSEKLQFYVLCVEVFDLESRVVVVWKIEDSLFPYSSTSLLTVAYPMDHRKNE